MSQAAAEPSHQILPVRRQKALGLADAAVGNTAADLAYVFLRDAIATLQFQPGDRLFRKELSRRLGVSLTPMRDALLRLEAIGLVSIRAQAETRVSLIERQRLFELHFQMMAMETEIVRRLARRGRIQFGSELPFLQFHQALFGAVGMELVFRGLIDQYALMMRCRAVVQDQNDSARLDFQRQVVDRVGAGDAQGAAGAMRALLSDDLALIGQAKRRRPDWFD